jgi:hypothetical protein
VDADPRDMDIHRNLAVLRFAVHEGDTRLAELIASALTRDRAALATAAPVPPRAVGEPSPLARRTLERLFTRLGLDEHDE